VRILIIGFEGRLNIGSAFARYEIGNLKRWFTTYLLTYLTFVYPTYRMILKKKKKVAASVGRITSDTTGLDDIRLIFIKLHLPLILGFLLCLTNRKIETFENNGKLRT
jgi:hypothetical protein